MAEKPIPTLPVLMRTVCSPRRDSEKKHVRRRAAKRFFVAAVGREDRQAVKWIEPYFMLLMAKDDREIKMLGEATRQHTRRV